MKLQTVEIDEFPFVIGRSPSASLQINSTSVSREHAEVLRTPTGFCVRDLNSTNGTSVNGRPVRETLLVDGDSVTIADLDLTFVITSMNRLQRTLTQPLSRKQHAFVLPGTSPELSATRSLTEALLLQSIPLEWSSLVDSSRDECLMASARITTPLDRMFAQGDAKLPTTVTSRLQLMEWRLAAEQFDHRQEAGGLLLNIMHRETLDQRVIVAVDEIVNSMNTPGTVGFRVHWEWATSTPDTLRLLSRLRELGHVIAFDEFTGGGGCIESMNDASPDYLVLSGQVVRDVAQQTRRLQRLEIVQTTCASHGVQVVLPKNISDEDRDACHKLGIHVYEQNFSAKAVGRSLVATGV